MCRDVLDVAVLLRPRACVLNVRDVEWGGGVLEGQRQQKKQHREQDASVEYAVVGKILRSQESSLSVRSPGTSEVLQLPYRKINYHIERYPFLCPGFHVSPLFFRRNPTL